MKSKPKAHKVEVISTALAVRERNAVSVRSRTASLYESFLADKSELTARNYRIDLQDFGAFLGMDAPSAIQQLCSGTGPEANHIVFDYKNHLKKKGYSASTINRRLEALRSISKLARMFGLMDWKLEVEGEKARTFKDTSGCGVEGLKTMVATIEQEIADNASIDSRYDSDRRWRDRALLHLMYSAGRRRMEPLTANYPDHVRLNPGDGSPELSIIGKKRAGEREWVPIGKTCYSAIQDWVKRRGPTPGPLFPGRDIATPLHPNSIGKLILRLATAAGVDVTPHGLRHTAITEVLERTGGDVRTAQRFARHSNPAPTMIYDDNRQKIAARGVAALEKEDEK